MFRAGLDQAKFHTVIIALWREDIRAGRRYAGCRSRVGGLKTGDEVVEAREGLVDTLGRINDDESLPDVGIKNGRVLNHVVKAATVIPSFKRKSRSDLIVEADGDLVLFVGFQAGGYTFFC